MSSVAKRRAGALKKAYLYNLFKHKNCLPLNTKCIGRFEVKDDTASIFLSNSTTGFLGEAIHSFISYYQVAQ